MILVGLRSFRNTLKSGDWDLFWRWLGIYWLIDLRWCLFFLIASPVIIPGIVLSILGEIFTRLGDWLIGLKEVLIFFNPKSLEERKRAVCNEARARKDARRK